VSLEQYKDASRKELWDILQIQMQVLQAEAAKIAELQSILTLFKKDLLASCKKERDKYKAYFDSTLEKDYPANKYPRTKKPNKGM
jgi:type II secretory pathway component PulJ